MHAAQIYSFRVQLKFKEDTHGGENKVTSHTWALLSFPPIYGNHWIIYKPLPLTLWVGVCVRQRGANCWAHHHHAVFCCCQCSCHCCCLASGSAEPRPVSSSWGHLRARLQPLQPLLLQTDTSSGSLCRATAASTLPQAAQGTGICHSLHTDMRHRCLLCLPSRQWMDRKRRTGRGGTCGKDTASLVVVLSILWMAEFESAVQNQCSSKWVRTALYCVVLIAKNWITKISSSHHFWCVTSYKKELHA